MWTNIEATIEDLIKNVSPRYTGARLALINVRGSGKTHFLKNYFNREKIDFIFRNYSRMFCYAVFPDVKSGEEAVAFLADSILQACGKLKEEGKTELYNRVESLLQSKDCQAILEAMRTLASEGLRVLLVIDDFHKFTTSGKIVGAFHEDYAAILNTNGQIDNGYLDMIVASDYSFDQEFISVAASKGYTNDEKKLTGSYLTHIFTMIKADKMPALGDGEVSKILSEYGVVGVNDRNTVTRLCSGNPYLVHLCAELLKNGISQEELCRCAASEANEVFESWIFHYNEKRLAYIFDCANVPYLQIMDGKKRVREDLLKFGIPFKSEILHEYLRTRTFIPEYMRMLGITEDMMNSWNNTRLRTALDHLIKRSEYDAEAICRIQEAIRDGTDINYPAITPYSVLAYFWECVVKACLYDFCCEKWPCAEDITRANLNNSSTDRNKTRIGFYSTLFRQQKERLIQICAGLGISAMDGAWWESFAEKVDKANRLRNAIHVNLDRENVGDDDSEEYVLAVHEITLQQYRELVDTIFTPDSETGRSLLDNVIMFERLNDYSVEELARYYDC